MSEWQPIETAPKDGTVVDLWIRTSCPQSDHTMVDFYDPNATKVKGQSLRHGRAVSFHWRHFPPNSPSWYSKGGFGYPLSPEVEPVAWAPIPSPPVIAKVQK